MAAAIKTLVDSGVPCYFIHGNRDFLIGQRYARESGMTLLPEEQVLNLYGRNILIMHGDTLCTDDTGYGVSRQSSHPVDPESVPRPAAVYSQPHRRQNARGQQGRQQQQIDDHHGRQPAGGGEGDGEASRSVADPWPYPSSRCAFPYRQRRARPSRGFRGWHSEGSMVKVTPEGVELIAFPF